jgi:hypothetical protein
MTQQLDQAIGLAPVSTIDVDHLVARARRRSRMHRLTVAGAAGATTLAVVGLVSALAFGTAGSTPVSRPPQKVMPAAAYPAAPVRDGETRHQIEQRIATALARSLATTLSGVQVTDGPTGRPGVVVSFDTRYSTDAVLTTPSGKSEVFLQSLPGGPKPRASVAGSASHAPPVAIDWIGSCAEVPVPLMDTSADGHPLFQECAESTGPQGQRIVLVSTRCPACSGHPTLDYDAWVTWSNARVEMVVTRDIKRGHYEPLAAPLLSPEQLVAIAVDPDLTVTS